MPSHPIHICYRHGSAETGTKIRRAALSTSWLAATYMHCTAGRAFRILKHAKNDSKAIHRIPDDITRYTCEFEYLTGRFSILGDAQDRRDEIARRIYTLHLHSSGHKSPSLLLRVPTGKTTL
jgi:hypothetical protein